jgi:hypothetical protein
MTKESWVNSWQGKRYFTAQKHPDQHLCPLQPPIQWVKGALSPGLKESGVNLTTDLHLVSRVRTSAATPPPSHELSWECTGTNLVYRTMRVQDRYDLHVSDTNLSIYQEGAYYTGIKLFRNLACAINIYVIT